MVKIQCELCGSIEIRKGEDGLFQCQNCGVKYSPEQAKKLFSSNEVSIDHSSEIDDLLLNAESLIKNKNFEKAKSCYERVLQIQPYNEQASKGLEIIQTMENTYYLERKYNKEEAIKRAIEYLKNLPDIVKDIENEMEIVSVFERWYPFSHLSASIDGKYSAIYCTQDKVPYIGIETKKDIWNGTEEHIPVTKYRNKVEEQPVSDYFTAVYSGNLALNVKDDFELIKLIADCEDWDELDSKIGDADEIVAQRVQLYAHFDESLQKCVKPKLLKELDMTKYSENQDGESVYMNTPFVENAKDGIGFNLEGMHEYLKQEFCSQLYDHLDDSKYKNIDYSVTNIQMNDCYLYYVPIQIMQYKYKGIDYYLCQILADVPYAKIYDEEMLGPMAAIYPAYKYGTVNEIEVAEGSGKVKIGGPNPSSEDNQIQQQFDKPTIQNKQYSAEKTVNNTFNNNPPIKYKFKDLDLKGKIILFIGLFIAIVPIVYGATLCSNKGEVKKAEGEYLCRTGALFIIVNIIIYIFLYSNGYF
jgi:tetratricopeptide (TPR) repeat protein